MDRTAACFALALILATVAGCVSTAKDADWHAGGTQAWFAQGWAYDGNGVVPLDRGVILIHANDAQNTGDVFAGGILDSQPWIVRFDRFAQQGNKTFQNGGVAADLEEHGASGHGDASIPQVHAAMAAWGEAGLQIGGKPVPDPSTGNATWSAHYMVIRTGVRNDATHGIWNKAKTAPYDPAHPADGYADPSDDEIHLVLRPHVSSGAAPIPIRVGLDPPQTNPTYAQTFELYENPFVGSLVNLTFTLTADPATLPSDLTFVIKAPDGSEVARATLPGSSSNTASTALASLALDQRGTYNVDVTGRLVNAQFEIGGVLTLPSNLVFNFWWENVLFGEAAETLTTPS